MVLTEGERRGTVDDEAFGVGAECGRQLVEARLGAALRLVQSVGVAALNIVLRRSARAVFIVGIVVASRCRHIVVLRLSFVSVVEAGHFGGRLPRLRRRLHAVVALAGHGRVVDVVRLSRQCEPVLLGVAHGEGASRVAVVASCGEVDVAYHALVVLLLQVHVQHELLVARVHTHESRLSSRLLVGLHLVHRVGRQVLQGFLGVAVEEVAAVDEQRAHLPSVDFYHTVLQCRPRQLADERVEHGTLGELEGRSVVDDCVALCDHLDFGGLHHQLVEHGGVFLEFDVAEPLLCHALTHSHLHPLVGRLIAYGRGAQDVFGVVLHVLYIIIGVDVVAPGGVRLHDCRRHHRAVLYGEQLHRGVGNRSACSVVYNAACQLAGRHRQRHNENQQHGYCALDGMSDSGHGMFPCHFIL